MANTNDAVAPPRLHRGQTRPDSLHIEIDGEIWAVHDTVFKGRRHVRTPLPSSRATHRVFVNEQGVRRSHEFKRGEIRELTASRLAVQLRGARYLPSKDGTATADYGTIGGPPPGGAVR
jgi:hypothetical protein